MGIKKRGETASLCLAVTSTRYGTAGRPIRWRGRRRGGTLEARHLIAPGIHALRKGDVVAALQAETGALGLIRADGAPDRGA